jgi:tetratricopeptide (TPR) repeat protein
MLTQTVLARSPSECDGLGMSILKDKALGAPLDRAHMLEQQGKGCDSTGQYALSVALLYQQANALDHADEIARAALAKGSPVAANLRHLLAESELSRGHVKQAYAMGEKVAQDYPSYVPVLGMLGTIDAQEGRQEASLERAKQWYAIDGSAGSLIAMTTILYMLHRYDETADAYLKAIKLEPDRIARNLGLTEAVFALAKLYRRPEAADLLRRHIAANPNWRESAPAPLIGAAQQLGLIDK